MKERRIFKVQKVGAADYEEASAAIVVARDAAGAEFLANLRGAVRTHAIGRSAAEVSFVALRQYR